MQNEETQGGMKNGTTQDKRRGARRNPETVQVLSILRAPATKPDVAPGQMPIPKLTPYAEQLLARSQGQAPNSPSPAISDDWMTTSAAARLSGYSRRHIYTLCENGFFVVGRDWKQRAKRCGIDRAGRVLIRRAALKKLEGEW